MKKASLILAAVVFIMLPAAALATDALIYEDTELGFSFELPEGMEYYGDLLEETQKAMAELDSNEIQDAMAETGQTYEKQPVYIRFLSDTSIDELNILYTESTDIFDELEGGLPDGVTRDEIDLYLLTETERQDVLDTLLDVDVLSELDGFEVLSSGMEDFGDKMCAAVRYKMIDPSMGVDTYRYAVVAYYRDYVITITYSNYDITGDMTADNAYGDFEAALETLSFDVVPSDKEARLVTGIQLDWIKIAAGAAGGAVIGIVVALITRRNRKKAAEQNNMGQTGNENGHQT